MSLSGKVAVIAFCVGVILILAGQSLYRYANQTIGDLETKLSQAGLLTNEYYILEGSLSWWRTAIVFTYGPISIFLMAAGIAVLALLTVYFALAILRSPKNNPEDLPDHAMRRRFNPSSGC